MARENPYDAAATSAAALAGRLTPRQWVALAAADRRGLRRGRSGWIVGFAPGRASIVGATVKSLERNGLVRVTENVATATPLGRVVLVHQPATRPDPAPRAPHAGQFRRTTPPPAPMTCRLPYKDE